MVDGRNKIRKHQDDDSPNKSRYDSNRLHNPHNINDCNRGFVVSEFHEEINIANRELIGRQQGVIE